MLNWKRADDSWLANGFRVHQVAPSLWSLDNVPVSGSVEATDPIAEMGSLEACKFTAQRLHDQRRLGAKRQGLAAAGIASWALALIAANPFAFIVGGVLGTAALLELLATWFEGRIGRAREYMQ